MIEEWKNIDGYDGDYQVSNLGRVRSLKFNKIKYLIFRLDNKGYYLINLSKNNKKKTFRVHQLVYDYFGTEKRNGRIIQVDHIDNDKLNNRIDNLQLLSNRDNSSKYHLTRNKTSKYTGVCWDTYYKKWRAGIRIGNYCKFLGNFTNEEDAHKAYQDALAKINNIKQKTL